MGRIRQAIDSYIEALLWNEWIRDRNTERDFIQHALIYGISEETAKEYDKEFEADYHKTMEV